MRICSLYFKAHIQIQQHSLCICIIHSDVIKGWLHSLAVSVHIPCRSWSSLQWRNPWGPWSKCSSGKECGRCSFPANEYTPVEHRGGDTQACWAFLGSKSSIWKRHLITICCRLLKPQVTLRASRLRLISAVSTIVLRSLLRTSVPRSLPAKSTNENLPCSVVARSLRRKTIWRTAWERDELALAEVWPDVLRTHESRENVQKHIVTCLFSPADWHKCQKYINGDILRLESSNTFQTSWDGRKHLTGTLYRKRGSTVTGGGVMTHYKTNQFICTVRLQHTRSHTSTCIHCPSVSSWWLPLLWTHRPPPGPQPEPAVDHPPEPAAWLSYSAGRTPKSNSTFHFQGSLVFQSH